MGFKRYVVKRVLLLVPILFGVSVISFSLIHFVPGGPVEAALGNQATPELIETRREQYGLNRPVYIQYIDWLTSALQGDFGESIRTQRDVTEAIATSFAPTVWVALSASIVSVLIGIPTGIVSAANHYSTKDYIATFFAFVGLSIPNFFLGLVLILAVGLYLGLLPTTGFVDPLQNPVDGIRHLILPAITLGTASSAVVMRMMRSSLLEVFSEEYIRTARAKGLTRRLVTNKHAVKNALIPTVTVIGLNFGYLLGGVVIVEQIFAIPGLGRLTLTAIFQREYRVIQASLLLIAFMFAIVNLLTDLVYAYLDPRIKYNGTMATDTDTGPATPEPSAWDRLRDSRSLQTGRRIFTHNRLAQLGLLITLAVILSAVFAPVVAPQDPTEQNIAEAQLESPSLDHPMGTDQFGRDILSRVIYGARISLLVGLIAVSFAILVGVPLGLLAGYFKGYVDEGIMRGMDILFAFPAILLAIGVMAVLGQSLVNVMLAIGIVYTPIFARVTRSGVLSVREEEYVTAAKAIGDTDLRIIRHDVLPNVVAPIIVQATISLAFAILAESALSFLGLGTPPPTPSWGRMLSESRTFMETAWWTVTFPGLAIMITILGFNFLGDALRDTLDPKQDTESGGGF